MSSADKQERGLLEEAFRGRMHDAEASPAPDLWTRIDHELTVAEKERYKERFVMYRQLAAACFVLFMLAGALLYYQFRNEAAQPVQLTIPAVPGNNESGLVTATDTNEPINSNAVAQAPEAASPAIAAVQAERIVVTQTAPDEISSLPALGARSEKAIATSSVNMQKLQQKQSNNVEAPAYAATGGTGNVSDSRSNTAPPALAGTESTKPNVQSVVVRQKQAEHSLSLPDDIMELGEPKYKTLAAADSQDKDEKQDPFRKPLGNATEKEQVYASAATASRWSVGMASGPSYFNQNIGLPDQMMPAVNHKSFAAAGPSTADVSATNMEAAREEYEENTDAAFSYGMEVRAGFRLSKKLKLLSGVGFVQNSARTKTSYIFRQFWFKPTTGEPYELVSTIFMPSLTNGFSPDSIAVEQTDPFYVNYQYRQITVPLGLQYEGKIGNRGWSWYVSGALAANFLTESKITTTSAEVPSFNYNNQQEESPFRKVQFSGNVGAGVGKRITESVMVVVGPEFRSYLSSMLARPDEALAPQGKPYAVGVNLGVQYLLGQEKKK